MGLARSDSTWSLMPCTRRSIWLPVMGSGTGAVSGPFGVPPVVPASNCERGVRSCRSRSSACAIRLDGGGSGELELLGLATLDGRLGVGEGGPSSGS